MVVSDVSLRVERLLALVFVPKPVYFIPGEEMSHPIREGIQGGTFLPCVGGRD